jgi:outer membrane immunogenic protein
MTSSALSFCRAAIALICSPAAAWAQESPAPFTGAYAGPEIGAHEHHAYFEETQYPSGTTTGRYYRAWGLGGGAFAGYDLAVTPRVRLGAEVGLSVGGGSPSATFSDGTTFSIHPRWGYRVTGKAGYLLNDRLMTYGTFGYGGHHYRHEGTASVADYSDWGSSFTIGAGFQYRLSDHVDLRLDFRHLDNQMSHILVGVPIRF